MIDVNKVVKTFDGFRALDELSLRVPTGAVYGLVGPNGSGKSTIIRHMTGVYRPDSGEVTVDGLPVYENPEVKEKIASIPDELFAFTSDSISDMHRFYKSIYKNFDEARFNALREVFRLDEKQAIRRFSKGMQKQASFWLSLCLRPEILILDEPVDGLDPVMRRQVWSLMLESVAETGTTVLVASHNLRELEDVCDHVGILHKGKMMLERALADLQDTIVKVQVVLPEGVEPMGLEVLHETRLGRVRTLIVRGSQQQVMTRMSVLQPLICDLLPLSLEEIFIYELGGADYAVKDIVL